MNRANAIIGIKLLFKDKLVGCYCKHAFLWTYTYTSFYNRSITHTDRLRFVRVRVRCNSL